MNQPNNYYDSDIISNKKFNYTFSTPNENINFNTINLNHNIPQLNKVNKIGTNTIYNEDMVNTESKLFNLDKPLSRDLNNNLNYNKVGLKKGINNNSLFNSESLNQRASNNIKDYSINRWYTLHKNPLDNIFEPFDRYGEDTVLTLLDNLHQCT